MIVCAVLVLTQDIQIYPRALLSLFHGKTRSAHKLPPEVRSEFVVTADKKSIEVWRMDPPPGTEAEPRPKMAAILFHGNADTVDTFFPIQAWIRNLGFTVYSFDYRGFGHSSGWPSEKGLYEDSDAVWDYVAFHDGFKPNEIMLLGFSLGCAPAAKLASLHPVRALVLLAPFASLLDVVREQPIVGYLSRFLWYKFPTIEFVSQLQGTQLVIVHGQNDSMIDVRHGIAVGEAAPDNEKVRRIISPEAGHNDLLLNTYKQLGETIKDIFAPEAKKPDPPKEEPSKPKPAKKAN